MAVHLKLHKEKLSGFDGEWIRRVYIAAKFATEDRQGNICLSPSCLCTMEVSECADSLIHELEDLKKQATRIVWDNHPSRKKKKPKNSH
ncbi:MAG: hypothetical protein ACREQR_19080 [Candidatus Binataceae bacterium]